MGVRGASLDFGIVPGLRVRGRLTVKQARREVDLGAFTSVQLDRDRRVASVGGGTKIRDLLAATLAAGLVTPMGSCGSVGVAGPALSGGDTAGVGA